MDNGDIYDGMFHNGIYNGFGLFYDFEANKFTFGKFVKSALQKIFQVGEKLSFSLISTMSSNFIHVLKLFLKKIKRNSSYTPYQIYEKENDQ